MLTSKSALAPTVKAGGKRASGGLLASHWGVPAICWDVPWVTGQGGPQCDGEGSG